MNTKKQSIQTEIDAAYLYKVLGEKEENPTLKNVFMQMHDIELGHAKAMLATSQNPVEGFPEVSLRAKTIHSIGKIIGYDFILGNLLQTEKRLSSNVVQSRQKFGKEKSVSDTAHVTILQNILNNPENATLSSILKLERKHNTVGGNALRAAVLGGNDGLVSNFSLVMGVAGATSGQNEIVLSGVAGLLAGALSMALGEWISVKSSQELYENQIALEMDELEADPEGEAQELALIFITQGLEESVAKRRASEIIADKDKAKEVLTKEELGINAEDLSGSPMEAAVTSFILFAIGAIIPLIPFIFWTGMKAIIISTVLSTFGLFLIGATITLFTGKGVWYSGMRQVIFGLAAAAVTYAIGSMIGVQIAG